VLVIDVPEDIPRAERFQLTFRSIAWAGYGSGKGRQVVRRPMFFAPLHVDIPTDRPLARGQHRHPFTIDVPPWLPPRFVRARLRNRARAQGSPLGRLGGGPRREAAG
jgi:hypothetical protein